MSRNEENLVIEEGARRQIISHTHDVLVDIQQIMTESCKLLILQRYPKQIGHRRHNIELTPDLVNHFTLSLTGQMNEQRNVEPGDSRIIVNPELLAQGSWIIVLRLQTEMVSV
ncbi:hypothetical protein D3C85_1179750 [compost metagenome]